MKRNSIVLMFVVILMTIGTAYAQYHEDRRYDPRSLEGAQTVTNDLMQQTRSLYLTAEREFPRFRSDNYVIDQMYRLYDESANFRKQMQRNYDNPEALRRSYQRLYSAWYNLDYAMQRTNRFGYLNDELRTVSDMVHELGRSLSDYGVDVDHREDY